MSIEKYKLATAAYHQNVEFNENDNMMARIRPERYPKHLFKKLHAQAIGSFHILHKLGSNAYYLELFSDLNLVHFSMLWTCFFIGVHSSLLPCM